MAKEELIRQTTVTREVFEFPERAMVVWHPPGIDVESPIKGSEVHYQTGYWEERDVPDAPGGKQRVFVVVNNDVRKVVAGDFKGLVPNGEKFLENAGRELDMMRTGRREQLAEARQAVADLGAENAALRETIVEIGRKVGEMEAIVVALTGENEALIKTNGVLASDNAALKAQIETLTAKGKRAANA